MLDPTLLGLLSQIERDEIVLPAMQRPFVWKEERIYRLIDSLLRGFPIGAIMLWKTDTVHRFRRLPRDIDTDGPEVFNFETSKDTANKYLVLDGQQRLTSLFAAFKGTYGHKVLYIDVLSGSPEGKDPGNEYYDCQFLSPNELSNLEANASGGESGSRRRHFMPLRDLIKINPVNAATAAHKKAVELKLTEKEAERVAGIYIRCATILGTNKSLQVITVDEDPSQSTPIEEVLEIFVRVNSGGLVLQKSDLLMSLLDLTWNDIQPELQTLVKQVNQGRPFLFTRDDVLKSLLLAEGAETRFDRLVNDRKQVARLGSNLPKYISAIKRAWQMMGIILLDDCRIHSERFFRGGHNALLPFVLFLAQHEPLSGVDRKRIAIGVYIALMTGVFSSAEARMGAFARNLVANAQSFPLQALADLVKREYGIKTLDDMLTRQLDLTLNIAHGGITLDMNPEELQRDHIFPRSQLEKAGYPYEKVNHYANFHFLRATDNLNKLDLPPDEWFRNPGKDDPPYTDEDLKERLLTWEDLAPGGFESMLSERAVRIRHAAEALFGLSESEFNGLFGDQNDDEPDLPEEDAGQVRTDPQLLDAKRQDAINAFAAKLGTQFIKRSRTLFSTTKGDVRVCCAVSKKYDSPYPPYWYRYDRKWHQFLEGGNDSYFILCCMDSPTGFAIPFSWMTEQKSNLNVTDRVNAFYWHIVLTRQQGGALALNMPKKGTSLPLTAFAFPIGKTEIG
jgi:hypothetical protein